MNKRTLFHKILNKAVEWDIRGVKVNLDPKSVSCTEKKPSMAIEYQMSEFSQPPANCISRFPAEYHSILSMFGAPP